MEISAYLARIGYEGSREPTLETLQALHIQHLRTVPFENLEIHLGHPITLSLPLLYDKIVRHRRGGFCYELNALFAGLLRQLDFKVTLLSARVFGATQLGPEYDHMLLLVEAQQRWIADVGFGDSFLQPLRLDDPAEQAPEPSGRAYRLLGAEAQIVLQQSKEGAWSSQYAFTLEPRQLAEFDAMCDYQQTSPASHFTRKAICSMATPQGRVSLSNHQLILSANGQREEREIADAESYRVALKHYFDIELDAAAHIERLMNPLTTHS